MGFVNPIKTTLLVYTFEKNVSNKHYRFYRILS